ncbi:MAG: hypothetical protein ABT01_07900 [Clostridium sp. SCN 57-10]|nr:MAG: hypothetical protein ABT01_07900 [Clostridium sp. SCN 57-10]
MRSFLAAFELMRAEIVFRQSEIAPVLETIARDCSGAAGKFYGLVRDKMHTGMTFGTAYLSLAPSLYELGLTERDVDLISEVARATGRFDAMTQGELFCGAAARITEEISACAAECAQKGRVYRAVGITAGVMLALVSI